MSSVRFICGTQDIDKTLEKVIADYYSVDDCILFPRGFDANAGFFEAIFGPEDLVVSDLLIMLLLLTEFPFLSEKRKIRPFRYEKFRRKTGLNTLLLL